MIFRVWLCCLLVACATASSRPAGRPKDGPTRVAILRSSDNALYGWAITAVQQALPFESKVLSVQEHTADELIAYAPSAIVAVGAAAAALATSQDFGVPIFLAMVLDPEEYVKRARAPISGVQFRTNPLTEFSQFKLVMPDLSRVLVLFHPRSSQRLIETAERELATMGITLTAIAIEDASEIPIQLARHAARADAIWLPADPVVMNERGFSLLKAGAKAAKKPLLASWSSSFARAGAMAAVSVDITSLGAQLAGQVIDTLRPKQPSAAKPAGKLDVPIGANLAVNIAVSESLGFALDPNVLGLASEVFSDLR